MSLLKKKRYILLAVLLVLPVLYLVPERKVLPVVGVTPADWNQNSFWYEPWGASGVHKGIDIFSDKGSGILSTTDGIVLYKGHLKKGGNVVIVLGPKWRIHYYAHLDTINAAIFEPVTSGEIIGTLGDSGNAKGKPPHLHYAIIRLFPVPWLADDSTQGYKKAYFIDPNSYLLQE